MRRNYITIFFILLLVFCISLASFPYARAQEIDPNFNPAHIISDFEILAYDSMALDEIKEFLNNKAGYLATASFADSDGKIMTTAEIIYDRAITNKVSPKFIIVLLQKEQSMIEDKNPTQNQLDWATGYGCPDSAPCNTRWQGFWKQVNSASLQFRDYMDNPQLYTYRSGKTYTFSNPYSENKEPTQVTPVNQATAALYNYTPHVYNGNYNFWKIWQKYFTRVYPDGSLLQAEGEPAVWLVENGKKRLFATKGALTSRFDPKKILTANKTDLDKYPQGAPIKFPQYSLVRSPRGTVFLLINDYRRGFASPAVFKNIGINPEEVVDVFWDDINAYQEGAPLTATSTYPTGALLQDKKSGGVFWVMDGKKSPLVDPIFLKTKFKNKKIIKATPEELEKYERISPALFDDGELLKSADAPAVYLISNGKKRPITSGKIFEKLGYKWENIITVPPKILYLYPDGEVLNL